SVCASSRSSFLRLSPISRTLRAFATITSCPNSLSKRLIQGECVPTSRAIRLCGSWPKTSRSAFALLRTRCSSCIWPDSSSTQYQLLRSPRSNPTVNFCREIFLLGFTPAVLTFFIAGLLFICASSTSITWERTASRPETGLLIPSDYNNDASLLDSPPGSAASRNIHPGPLRKVSRLKIEVWSVQNDPFNTYRLRGFVRGGFASHAEQAKEIASQTDQRRVARGIGFN